MAIYYGPPNFKAFYRRAVALARLRMWKKAIAGQSPRRSLAQAFLIALVRLQISNELSKLSRGTRQRSSSWY